MRLLSLSLLLLLSLSSLAKAEAPLEKVSVMLQWKHQFEFAGFYAAIEKGYYQDAGLEVQLIEPEGLQSPTEKVLDGTVNYAVAGSSATLEYLEGQPIVLLANFFKRSPLAIVAQPDIKTPQDLKGRTMMAPLQSGFKEVSLLAMLKHFGVTLDMIDFKTPNYQLQSFLDKEVDAFVIFTTNELFDLEKLDIPFTLLDPIQYGFSDYDVNLITTQKEWSEFPERSQRFKEATIKGWQYALNHPTEVIDWILEKYNSQNKTREHLMYEARATHQVMLPELYPIGSIDLQRLNLTGRTLRENGLLAPEIVLDFENFISNHQIAKRFFSPLEVDYIRDKRVVTICADPSWMPFEQIVEGKHVGMSADYYDLISKKTGLRFELVPTTSWAQSLEFAEQRKCDLLSLAMETPERKKYMNFTQPVLNLPLVLATKADELFIDDLTKVLNRPLGIVKGYAYYEILKAKYPDIQLLTVNSIDEGLEKVRRGELFGMIDSSAAVGYAIQQGFVGELIIAGKFDEHWTLGFGVRNDDPLLLEVLKTSINKITQDEKREIYNKWVSVVFKEEIDYELVVKILVSAFIILLFLIYHLSAQRRMVKQLSAANLEINTMNKTLEKLAVTDYLTQVSNRSEIDRELLNTWHLYQRYQTPFSVLLLDIDHFKTVNDELGHLEGDKVLVAVANALKYHVRETDMVGRWGGEEFVVICPSTHADDARMLAEKLRQEVENLTFEKLQTLTISIGVAEASPLITELDQLIKHADDALYRAKKHGRNQVYVS